jgi:HSP20 family protein
MPRDLIRFMQSLFLSAARNVGEGCWYPSADIYRTPTGWLVKLDLAGVRPEEVELHVAGPKLIMTGARRDRCVEEERHCYRMEIAYSRFERVIELPADLDQAAIDTEYRDGMLMIRIQPEAPSSRPLPPGEGVRRGKHGNAH